MVMNPEIQKRAQAEIDLLTEGRRLPTLEEYAGATIIKYYWRQSS